MSSLDPPFLRYLGEHGCLEGFFSRLSALRVLLKDVFDDGGWAFKLLPLST